MAGGCHLGEREVKAQGLGNHHILCSGQGSWRDGGGNSRETVGKGTVFPLIPHPANASISRCCSTGQGHTESAREPGTLQQASWCETPPDHSDPLSGRLFLLHLDKNSYSHPQISKSLQQC